MLRVSDPAPGFSLPLLDGETWKLSGGRPTLLLFFETDCPTCRLTLPYLNRLARHLGEHAEVIGISQDSETLTREIIERAPITFPVALDKDLRVSRLYDPVAVPTLFLV